MHRINIYRDIVPRALLGDIDTKPEESFRNQMTTMGNGLVHLTLYHIEADTEWPFSRQRLNFVLKCEQFYFIISFTEVCS